jgi:pSer/pThr/pTyr-binding forkhead associated (FHA) protein
VQANTIQKPIVFFREGNEVTTSEAQTRSTQSTKKLHVQLKQHEQLAVVEQTPKSASQGIEEVSGGAMWKCVDEEGQALEEGDFIRVGRHKFTVLQIFLTGEPQIPRLDAGGEDDDPVAVTQCVAVPRSTTSDSPLSSPSSSARCRICLGEMGEEGDEELGPMIQAPCLCKGSNGRVHMKCIGDWLAMRRGIRREGDNLSFDFKPPSCEICKTEYPVMIRIGDGEDARDVPMISLPEISPPFIVFDQPSSSGERKRFVFVPSEVEQVFNIGRGHQCQMRISDVSVSRVHSFVSFAEGAFVLRDNGAKFQTCIRPKGQQVLDGEKTLKVQMGRTVLQVALLEHGFNVSML